MRQAILASLLASAIAGSTQIFHMTLYEALCFSDNVYVVRITGMVHMPMDYMDRMEYYIEVLDVVSGVEPPEDYLVCSYSMMLPRCMTDEDGNEIWESPLVTGTGDEFSVSEGDTLIVLTSTLVADSAGTTSVVRIEPMESMDEILRILEEEFSD